MTVVLAGVRGAEPQPTIEARVERQAVERRAVPMALVGHQQAVGTDGAGIARPQRVDDGDHDVVGGQRARTSVAELANQGSPRQRRPQHGGPLPQELLGRHQHQRLAPPLQLLHDGCDSHHRLARPGDGLHDPSPAAPDPSPQCLGLPGVEASRGRVWPGHGLPRAEPWPAEVVGLPIDVGRPPPRGTALVAAEAAVRRVEQSVHRLLVGVVARGAQDDGQLCDRRARVIRGRGCYLVNEHARRLPPAARGQSPR